jgi:hypothetical protein
MVTEQFVFPYGDWAHAAARELRELGYTTVLRRQDDNLWVLDVTGSVELMLAMREAAEQPGESVPGAGRFNWEILINGLDLRGSGFEPAV